jgi:hypothetical protein
MIGGSIWKIVKVRNWLKRTNEQKVYVEANKLIKPITFTSIIRRNIIFRLSIVISLITMWKENVLVFFIAKFAYS